MNDSMLNIRNGTGYIEYRHPGPTDVQVAAAGALTHAAYDSGYVRLLDTDQIPHRGFALQITIPGPLSATGATGTATLTPTITFSDDGSAAAGATITGAALNFATASSTTTINGIGSATAGATSGLYYLNIPKTKHAYIRVQLATVLGTITTMNYGPVDINLVPQATASEATNVFYGG